LRIRAIILFFVTAFFSSLSAAEIIERIQIVGNHKTDHNTILRVSQLLEGQEITKAILQEARDLLVSSGVFESVQVELKPGKDPISRIVIITVKEKTTWFIVPAFSYSQSGIAGGGVIGETNLFGRLKKAIVFGDWGTTLKRGVVGYRDQSVFGSRMTLGVDGIFRLDEMSEFSNRRETRKVRVREYGGTFLPGIRWTENVTTSLGLYFRKVRQHLRQGDLPLDRPSFQDHGTDIAVVGQFDFRKSTYIDGLMDGTEVQFISQFSDDRYFSDFDYQKQLIYLRQAFRFFHDQMSSVTNATVQLGKNLPYYIELMSGGDNLRGYLSRQFRGDTKYAFGEELFVPIHEFKRFILRTNVFWDTGILYFKDVKDDDGNAFSRDKWHNGVGVGLRCYLRGINIPLFGFDFARGLEDGAFAYYITVGAAF
jgi:outer membrane protein assembly factor BamA